MIGNKSASVQIKLDLFNVRPLRYLYKKNGLTLAHLNIKIFKKKLVAHDGLWFCKKLLFCCIPTQSLRNKPYEKVECTTYNFAIENTCWENKDGMISSNLLKTINFGCKEAPKKK